jgi:hypothetical protein
MTHPYETPFRLPTNEDIPIWRYMDLGKYLSMLDCRCLFFARATRLNDPFEGSTTKAIVAAREYIKANRAADPSLADWKKRPTVRAARRAEVLRHDDRHPG